MIEQSNILSKILIVEEDDEMREVLVSLLESASFSVDYARCSEVALKKAKENKFDIVLIERQLPEVSGLEVIRALRTFSNVPVLFLTTQIEPDEILKALAAGADDYLQKPFERMCLLSRVKSLLRRFSPTDLAETQKLGKLMMGALVIDTNTFDVFAGSSRIQLTPSEFKLLHALALNRGKVLTREHLIELVQGQGIAVIDRAIDTHVFGLRKKLGTNAEIVETVRGIGYRISG